MAKLATRHCTTLKKGTTPIRESVAQSLLSQLHSAWKLSKDKQSIVREFVFEDFQQTMGFVNAVAWIANHEDHHPDLQIGFKHCELTYTSHIAGGLTVNDFICAAKTDALFKPEVKESDKPASSIKKAKKAETTSDYTESLVFDAAEASALLDIESQKKPVEPAKQATEEDEFELIDPDDVSTVLQTKPAAAPSQESEDVRKTPAAAPVAKTEAKPVKKPETKPTTPPQTKSEAKPAPATEAESETKPASAPKTKSESKPAPATEAKSEPKPAVAAVKPGAENPKDDQPNIDPSISKAADELDFSESTKGDVDFMSTVILPPGMESVTKPSKSSDEDDDSTIIMPDTTATAELDDEYVDNATQDTQINASVAPESDMERTMILAPEQIEQISDAANKLNLDEKSADEENVEKTMVLSSDPTNAMNRKSNAPEEPAVKQEIPQNKHEEKHVERTMVLSSDPTRALNKSSNSEEDTASAQTPSHEDQVERTMVLSSDPTKALKQATAEYEAEKTVGLLINPTADDQSSDSTGSKEDNTEKTVSLTESQSLGSSKQQTEAELKPDDQAAQKADPEIEHDETLVMHCNTYKPVKNKPEQ